MLSSNAHGDAFSLSDLWKPRREAAATAEALAASSASGASPSTAQPPAGCRGGGNETGRRRPRPHVRLATVAVQVPVSLPTVVAQVGPLRRRPAPGAGAVPPRLDDVDVEQPHV
jgi:hypothetical protein